MKTLVPTLTAIALMGVVAPQAAAVSISDNDLSLTIGEQIQARADIDRAKDGNSNDYNPEAGTDFDKAPPAEFYLRRARLAFKGTYKQDWGFNVTLRADGAGRGGTNAGVSSATGSAGENPLLQQAYIYRVWKMDDMTHQVQIGQDYAFQNRSNNVVSSTELLLPDLSVLAALLNARAPGIGYRFNSPLITFGADIQNNTADNGGVAGGATGADTNNAQGLYYGARIELTGPGAWMIKKDTESFAGKQGMGARIGGEVADNTNARASAGGGTQDEDLSTLHYGVDGLFHLDGLTFLAEAGWDTVKAKFAGGTPPTPGTATPADSKRTAWNVQAGYAFDMDGWAIEPAARYERLDTKSNGAGADLYGANNNDDYGNSGKQFAIGLNFYWAGHNSKTQLEYVNWKGLYGGTAAEASGGANAANASKAKASIFRLQQQLTF